MITDSRQQGKSEENYLLGGQLSPDYPLAKAKDFLTNLFFSNKLSGVLKQMLHILNSRLEIIRKNRSFERPKTSSRRRSKLINSKGI